MCHSSLWIKKKMKKTLYWSHMPFDVQLNAFSLTHGKTVVLWETPHRKSLCARNEPRTSFYKAMEITTMPPCCYRNMKTPFLCDGISAQRRMDWNSLPSPHMRINKQTKKQTNKRPFGTLDVSYKC